MVGMAGSFQTCSQAALLAADNVAQAEKLCGLQHLDDLGHECQGDAPAAEDYAHHFFAAAKHDVAQSVLHLEE